MFPAKMPLQTCRNCEESSHDSLLLRESTRRMYETALSISTYTATVECTTTVVHRAATNETPGLRPTPSAPTSFGATTTEPTARTSPTPSCQWPSPSDTDSQTTWHTGNGSTTSSYVEGPSTTGTPGVPTYAARTQTADVQTRGRRREISHGTKSRSCYS